MTVENATFLNQLNPAYPLDGDLIKEGDDHIRLIKTTLRNTFTAMDTPLTTPVSVLNELANYKKYISDTLLATLSKSFPVGHIEITTSPINPATYLGFGTWSAFGAGQVLIGAGTHVDSRGETKTIAGGSSEGAYKHLQTPSEMPSHKHNNTISYTNLGTKTTDVQGDHRHAYMMDDNTGLGTYGGNQKIRPIHGGLGSDGGGSLWLYNTNQTGNHAHNVTIGAHGHGITNANTGSSIPMNNMQPSLGVYFWKRTA